LTLRDHAQTTVQRTMAIQIRIASRFASVMAFQL
jgi:hypothetical protein